MTTVALAGCRPEPLAAYLKALGVLRLVHGQADTAAAGWWEGDTFRLESALDADGLVDFLVEQYRPTPVLSPWNRDTGFKEAGSTATKTLLEVEGSSDPRFATYRAAIGVVRGLRADPRWGDRPKHEQVSLLRNHLPDDALDWLDAAIVLRPEKPAFPALLGSGGNLGRLELSPTFMARLLQVLDPAPKSVAASRAWITAALFETGSPALRSDPVGQFDPGSAGGIRADAVGAGKAVTNPWDLVLVIEGTMVWAGGVARRLGGTTSLASIPFTVVPTAVGYASLSPVEKARAELWAPLWSRPLGMPALGRLFAEGRISWSARQARSGLDAVRAMCTLGVDAGIGSFVRHLVADRMGQSPLAVPVGRFEVRPRPSVAVLSTVDRWAERFGRAAATPSAPTSWKRAATRLERAVFTAASGKPRHLQEVLIELAAAESVAGQTQRARADGTVPPVRWLPVSEWLPALDDGSPELRLAASLAIARDGAVRPQSVAAGLLRSIVRPISAIERHGDRFADVEWSYGEAIVPGLGRRPIAEVLADALVVRSEAERAAPDDEEPASGWCEPWFPAAVPAATGDAEALAAGRVDLARISDLVCALLLLSPEPRFAGHRWTTPGPLPALAVPAWRVLAPFYSSNRVGRLGQPIPLRPRSGWARRLVADNCAGVLADALLRWEQAGFKPVYRRRAVEALAVGIDGRRLAAALLCGATRSDVRMAAGAVVQPESEEPSEGDHA
ncbi:MAG: type I-G CRISPR-associated protein Cas8g1/Csx17 [Acidimicrobiia bacterium]